MKIIILSIVVSFLCAVDCLAQIDQTHPELCGKPDGFVPLPSNVSATIDRSTGEADLLLKTANSTAKINLRAVVNKISEVCPLSDGRLLIFGDSGYSQSMHIIDTTTASLLDEIWGFTPAMSPNQRWLVYRKFYPRHTDLPVSEEYLLYDLTKSPTQNRLPDVPLTDHDNVGIAIFPLGQKNLNGEHIGVPDSQQHSFKTNAFLWAPDSRAIVFADILQSKLSIVLVALDEKGNTKSLVRPVSISEICGPTTQNGDLPLLDDAASAVESDQGGDRLIHLVFITGMVAECDPKKLDLRLGDFQQAATEVHVQRKPTHKAIVVDQ